MQMTIHMYMYINWLVVSTHVKNMLVKLEIFPNFRGGNKEYLSCHHLVNKYIYTYNHINLRSIGSTPKKSQDPTFQVLKGQGMLKAIRPFRNQQEVLPAGKEVVKS